MSDVHFEFDENFSRVIKRADRREMMRYRNAIIDELKTRDDARRKGFTKTQLRAKKRLDTIVSGADIFFSLILIIILVADFYEYAMGRLTGTNLLVVVIIDLFIIAGITLLMSNVFSARRKRRQDKSPVATGKDELARSLKRDSTERLEKKQEILDQKLGL